MKINTSIIDDYLKNFDINTIKDSWIFSTLEPNQYKFETPAIKDKTLFIQYYSKVLKFLKNFTPVNLRLWQILYGQYTSLPEDIDIYLVVGCPDPYDAMVRFDNQGKKVLIFDLIRIMSYSKDYLSFQDNFTTLITHEFSHIYLGENYPHLHKSNLLESKLRDLVFDEGFAHILGFSDGVLSFDFSKHDDKKIKSYKKLYEVISNPDKADENLLLEANAGPYWDKYAAISGKFLILDYYYKHNKDIKKIQELYKAGPDFLWSLFMDTMKILTT